MAIFSVVTHSGGLALVPAVRAHVVVSVRLGPSPFFAVHLDVDAARPESVSNVVCDDVGVAPFRSTVAQQADRLAGLQFRHVALELAERAMQRVGRSPWSVSLVDA